jgi:hypothetical protein
MRRPEPIARKPILAIPHDALDRSAGLTLVPTRAGERLVPPAFEEQTHPFTLQ